MNMLRAFVEAACNAVFWGIGLTALVWALQETADVRLHQPLAKPVRRLSEAVCVVHPDVWWIGWQLRCERQIACDDWVVAQTGHAKPYAAALARLVELFVFRRASILATGA